MKRRRLLNLSLLIALLTPMAGISVGCVLNPATGERDLILIPRDQEIAMGLEAAPQFEKQFGGRVADESVQAYVTKIGQSVSGVAERKMPYEFTLVTSEIPNAFALPGGKIFVTAGLMARLTNERQLAGVLGHEVGHVSALHNVKGMQRQMGAGLLVEVAGWAAGADKAGAAKAASKVAAAMAVTKYGRDDEYQADMLGVRYLAKAGYNPYGMVEVLQVLKGLSDSEPDTLAEMFQTHPLTSKRIAEAEQIVRDVRPDAKPDTPDPNIQRFLAIRKKMLGALPRE